MIAQLELLLTLVAVVVTAVRVRRTALPDAPTSQQRLAEVVVGISEVVVTSEVLGAVQAWSLGWLLLVTAALGLSSAALEAPRPPARTKPSRRPDLEVLIASVATAVVTAPLWTGVISAWRWGVRDFDSTHYHLTAAAFAAQHHDWGHLDLLSAGDAAPYHPMNTEVLQGLGFLAFGDAILTPLISVLALVLLGLALVAITGRRWPLAFTLTALLLAGVVYGLVTGGTATNDLETFAFLLAGVSFLGPVRDGAPVPWLAGLALGLSLGTKLSAIAVVGVLVVGGWWLMPRGRRLSGAAQLWLATALTSAFWYARDAATVGNPLPGLDLDLGFLHLRKVPTPIDDYVSDTLGKHLADLFDPGSVLSHGARHYLGPLWPLAILLPLAGIAWALRLGLRRSARHTVLGLAGVAGTLAYLGTPTSAFKGIILSASWLNVRYWHPAALLGIVVVVEVLKPRWARLGLAGVALVSIVIATATPDDFLGGARPAEGIALALAASVGVAGLCLLSARGRSLEVGVGLATLAVGVIPAMSALHIPYDRNTYPVLPQVAVDTNLAQPAFTALRHVRHARIAVVEFPSQVPYYGPGLTNTVTYVGHVDDRGSLQEVESCAALLGQLQRGHFGWVVLIPYLSKVQSRWVADSPHVHLVAAVAGLGGTGGVWRVDPGISPDDCRSG